MKKIKILIAILTALLTLSFSACTSSNNGIKIAVPNDPTNEARALILLQDLGYIKLADGVGITATKLDIVDNPYNITIEEVEAAQIPNVRKDVDFAIINSNYAIDAGISPKDEALALEGSSSPYANILAVKNGNENNPAILALKAALESTAVKTFIENTYGGSVVSVVDNPTDGYDSSIDYNALKGTEIKVAASPTPHAQILAIAKNILKEKEITLTIIEYTDYVIPNTVVDTGEVDANYFQHLPYLNNFNEEKHTDIVSVSAIHVEPLGIYSGKKTSLDQIKK